MNLDPFKEYLKIKDPDKRDKGYAWNTAIGLQAVDGLETSEYLRKAALDNIEGYITIEEAKDRMDSYYKENSSASLRTEEADKVSVRIAEILSEKAFTFSVAEYISIHKRLFEGIYKHAGKVRDYNITKKEWVLDGASVTYGSAMELKATLEYDINKEKSYNYSSKTRTEIVGHLARFIADLWQIHAFGEGNTRTTAVFFIKYLRTLGFDVTNDIFADNSWYFRNAMVRANYNDLQSGIRETTAFLEQFIDMLLYGETYELHNRNLHISAQKVNIDTQKVNIDTQNVNIGNFSAIVQEHIKNLSAAFGDGTIFGRADVMNVIGVKPTRASQIINQLATEGIIEPVRGHGKGKYKFK